MHKRVCRTAPFFMWIFMMLACQPHQDDKHITAQNILKPCDGFVQIGKPPLVYGAECGQLVVKEDPDNPASATLSLHILRLPAISPAPKKDALFLIQGGPGGSSVEMAETVHGFFNAVRKDRDLVFVDQRGTGQSNAMGCEQLSNDDQLLPEAEQAAKYLNLLKACSQKFQQQAKFYATPYAVKDLHLVRQALGYPQVNLWGGSYGTRVALEYARQYPQETRAIILDGVAPVQIALPKYFAEDAGAALQAVNQECQAEEECRRLFGDIVLKAQTVTNHLLAAEQAGNPVKVQFEHPRHGQPDLLFLSAKHFAELVFMALYSRDLTALLPHAIADAAVADYRLLATLSALAKEQSSFTGISEGMRYSVICNEDAHFISADDIAQSQPFLGMNMVKDIAEVCAFWPRAELPPAYFEPVSSQVPALLLSGNHDPVTPSRWAQQVARHLPHSLQLVAPGGNHAVSMEGCLPRIIGQFIASADIHALKTDCVNDIAPLPLVLGANTPKNASQPEAVIRSGAQHDSH